MRRWERNGCAVHAELPFRFSVICKGTYNDKENIINFVKNYPENKDIKLIKEGILKELFEYVNGR